MIWKIVLVLVYGVGALAQTFMANLCPGDGANATEVQETLRANYHCFNNIINIENLNKEVEEAVSNGTVQTILKKHCPKASQLKPCLHQLSDAVAPCQIQFYLGNVGNYAAIDRILDFACNNDGENIATFFAEGGAQCVVVNANWVKQCVPNILKKESLTDIRNSYEVSCRVLNEIHACLMTTVQNCPTPAATNFLTQIIAIVQKAHNCTH